MNGNKLMMNVDTTKEKVRKVWLEPKGVRVRTYQLAAFYIEEVGH